jgi:hypothetical protein
MFLRGMMDRYARSLPNEPHRALRQSAIEAEIRKSLAGP